MRVVIRFVLLIGAVATLGAIASAAAVPRRELSESANHTTVTVARGTLVSVTLHSTYWTFRAPGGSALRAAGKPLYEPAPVGRCVPGEGCGTVTQTYRALRGGKATISAGRVSCGEALACGPSNGSYTVRVIVTAH